MLSVTGWAVITWLRITLALVVVVALGWWLLGTASGWFWLITGAAVLVELYTIRQLGREWSWQARAHWWWAR
jgi:hypothetical protein